MNENYKINNIDKWTVKPKEDGYTSPIAMIVEDVNIKIENDIVKAVQNYDIKVDREELAKALAYDRLFVQDAEARTATSLLMNITSQPLSHISARAFVLSAERGWEVKKNDLA